MRESNELDEILFKKPKQKGEMSKGEDLRQLIETIPLPHDITITSYSEFSDNTPQKYINKPFHTENAEPQSYNLKRLPTAVDYATDGSDMKKQQKLKPRLEQQKQIDFHASAGSGGSYLESMTPQRMNQIVDWSKNHVTPGDSKNIFPQVMAPSIEFSNENSLSLQAFSKQTQPHPPHPSHPPQTRLEGKMWDKQKKHMEQELFMLKKQLKKQKQDTNILQNKLGEADEKIKLLQEKSKDYSCLENLRGKNLEMAKQQIKQLKNQLEQRDNRIEMLEEENKKLDENEKRLQEAIESELRELHNHIELKDQMLIALKNQKKNDEEQRQQALLQFHESMEETTTHINKLEQKLDIQNQALNEKDQIIKNLEKQCNLLQERLKNEIEFRKQDQNLINELKQKETFIYNQINPQSSQYTQNNQNNKELEELQRENLNQKRTIMQLNEQLNNQFCIPTQSRIAVCQECQNMREEINNIIKEGELDEELSEQPSSMIREVVTAFLRRQQQNFEIYYELDNKELRQQLAYFKEQNEEVLQENNKISEQIKELCSEKELQEQRLFNEYDKLRINYQQVQQQLQQYQEQRSQKQSKSINEDELEIELYKQQVQQLKHDLSQQQEEINQYSQKLLEAKQLISQLQQQYKNNTSCDQLYKEQMTKLEKELQQLKKNEILYKQEIKELSQQQIQYKNEIEQLNQELDNKRKQINEKEQEYLKFQETSANKSQQKQRDREIKEKAIQELQDEKSKLVQRIHQLEQQTKKDNKENEQKQIQEKLEKTLTLGKEKDKKNIELYNTNKNLQQANKELEEQFKFERESNEKMKKQIQLKNQENKQLIESNKELLEKNHEMNIKLNNLQEQIKLFEQEIKQNYIEQSLQIPEKLKSHPSSKSLETIKTPSNKKVIELVEGFNQYQQEFYHLKRMFTEKLKQSEVLTETIQQLQQTNFQMTVQNQKLLQENQLLREEQQTSIKKNETGVRGSAATGDSLNIKSFLHQEENNLKLFLQNQQLKCSVDHTANMSIIDMIQPEMMSMEDTLQIFKEIMRRAVRSVEMIRGICEIQEIKELLFIIVQVDEKLQQQSSNVTQTKRNKIISSIIMNSNTKYLGSDPQRKKSGQRQKPTHRSEAGVVDFFDC